MLGQIDPTQPAQEVNNVSQNVGVYKPAVGPQTTNYGSPGDTQNIQTSSEVTGSSNRGSVGDTGNTHQTPIDEPIDSKKSEEENHPYFGNFNDNYKVGNKARELESGAEKVTVNGDALGFSADDRRSTGKDAVMALVNAQGIYRILHIGFQTD